MSRCKRWAEMGRPAWAIWPPHAIEDMPYVHAYPTHDIIEHDLVDDCVCGPEMELEPSGTWLVVHHSLDGREQHEQD